MISAKQPTVPPQATDVAGDVTVAREAAGFVAYVRRTARRFIHAQTLMTSCVKHLVYVHVVDICHNRFIVHAHTGILLRPDTAAQYCRECVSLSVHTHISRTVSSNLPVLAACGRGSVLLCRYVLLILWMTSCLYLHNGPHGA